VPPINLVGDLGGGASSMAFGIVCALLEARTSGEGQVVDANVLDATTTIMGFVQGLRAQGVWSARRGENLLDTGSPYYDTYACADGRWVAMGTIEERFFLVALDVLGFRADDPLRRAHKDRALWPALRTALAEAFATRTRDEWAVAFRDHDACVTPVLDPDEAVQHEQAVARGAYQPLPGYAVAQPAVSPRFSRSRTSVPPPPARVGEHTDAVLAELGYAPERVASLRANGVVG
jgi:alpha-methylacyl-CoA racemase